MILTAVPHAHSSPLCKKYAYEYMRAQFEAMAEASAELKDDGLRCHSTRAITIESVFTLYCRVPSDTVIDQLFYSGRIERSF